MGQELFSDKISMSGSFVASFFEIAPQKNGGISSFRMLCKSFDSENRTIHIVRLTCFARTLFGVSELLYEFRTLRCESFVYSLLRVRESTRFSEMAILDSSKIARVRFRVPCSISIASTSTSTQTSTFCRKIS